MMRQVASRAVFAVGLIVLSYYPVSVLFAQESKPVEENRAKPAVASDSSASDQSDAAPDETVPLLQVFHLRFASAFEASQALASVLDRDLLRIGVDQRTNSVIVQASSDVLHDVAQVLEAIDSPTSQREAAPAEKAGTRQRLLFFWLATGPELATDQPIPAQLDSYPARLRHLTETRSTSRTRWTSLSDRSGWSFTVNSSIAPVKRARRRRDH
jgi:hypothetical protein